METKKVEISEENLEAVVGGTIVFNGAHTTCGRNCNNQYSVHNYDAAVNYIKANRNNMSEKTMLSNMCSKGYLSKL